MIDHMIVFVDGFFRDPKFVVDSLERRRTSKPEIGELFFSNKKDIKFPEVCHLKRISCNQTPIRTESFALLHRVRPQSCLLVQLPKYATGWRADDHTKRLRVPKNACRFRSTEHVFIVFNQIRCIDHLHR